VNSQHSGSKTRRGGGKVGYSELQCCCRKGKKLKRGKQRTAREKKSGNVNYYWEGTRTRKEATVYAERRACIEKPREAGGKIQVKAGGSQKEGRGDLHERKNARKIGRRDSEGAGRHTA